MPTGRLFHFQCTVKIFDKSIRSGLKTSVTIKFAQFIVFFLNILFKKCFLFTEKVGWNFDSVSHLTQMTSCIFVLKNLIVLSGSLFVLNNYPGVFIFQNYPFLIIWGKIIKLDLATIFILFGTF